MPPKATAKLPGPGYRGRVGPKRWQTRVSAHKAGGERSSRGESREFRLSRTRALLGATRVHDTFVALLNINCCDVETKSRRRGRAVILYSSGFKELNTCNVEWNIYNQTSDKCRSLFTPPATGASVQARWAKYPRKDKIRTSQVHKTQDEAMMGIIAEVKCKSKLSNPPSKAASLSRHRTRVIPQAPDL